MKTKYTSMFGLLVVAMLVASFVVPVNLMTSASPVAADPGVMRWTKVDTPGTLPPSGDLSNVGGFGGSAIHDLAVGPDSTTLAATLLDNANPAVLGGAVPGAWMTTMIRNSPFMGIGWPSSAYNALTRSPTWGVAFAPPVPAFPPFAAAVNRQVFHIAIAPDDAKFWAVTSNVAPAGGPREVWITKNGGASWEVAQAAVVLVAGETIRAIDISIDYGGKRDIAVATVAAAGGNIYVVQSTGFGGWLTQNMAGAGLMGAAFNYFAVKFSPTYSGDSGLAFVAANGAGSWYNIGLRDIATGANNTVGLAFTAPGVEIRDPTWAIGAEANQATLNVVDMALPSDFSATAVSLRRAYISLDAYTGIGKVAGGFDGIFRIDDTTVYTLMDTHNDIFKSIYSIAYFGTYASGKLLAGERMGYPCSATVPTWFTDSPTTCPIPCWYPALKPTTGAALTPCVVGAHNGFGGAVVAWNPAGTLGYVATGTQTLVFGLAAWWAPWLVIPAFGLPNREGAFAISRNNGETWNQLGMTNTTVDWINDVAPAPDCSTVYIATSNRGTGFSCFEFDSVWRSSMNSAVTAPLPPMPIGTYWERVFTHVTAVVCSDNQSDLPLLRLPTYCADLPDGQLIGWAAQGTRAQAWSPDFGDYWAMITPRYPIQDFAFESSKVMYNLQALVAAAPPAFPFPFIGGSLVQKLPFTGTAWSTLIPDVDASLTTTHTIVAYPEGNVLVGADTNTNLAMAAGISTNFATDTPSFNALWMIQAGATSDHGFVHTAFDTHFKDNGIIYIADSNIPGGIVAQPDLPTTGLGSTGSVYRNKTPGALRFVENNMMDPTNGAVGSYNQIAPFNADAPISNGLFGLVSAFTGATTGSNGQPDTQTALYVASDNVAGLLPPTAAAPYGGNSVVFRTLWPLDGMPKPGIIWDALAMYSPTTTNGVNFTLEPSSLKECGSCTIDTNTTLYAIDDEAFGQFMFSEIAPTPAGGPWWGYDPLMVQQGELWTYTDCLAKKGPALITEDKTLIGCDPVSGRAQEVNLCWEQLCVATGYDVEIGKNENFSIKVIDWVGMDNPILPLIGADGFLVPASRLVPCAYIPSGGTLAFSPSDLAVSLSGLIECGHTYYWRVMARLSATGEVARSPWSQARSFTIKAGLPVTTPYYGPQLLAPNNGCLGCPAKPASFSWSPFKETSKWKFVLAKDAAMTQVVKEAEVATTAFEYDGTLDNSTNYFWRVMALEPAPSDWSATFSFQTEAPPAPAPAAPKTPATPLWVWVVIAIGVILVVVTLVLIFKTRRT